MQWKLGAAIWLVVACPALAEDRYQSAVADKLRPARQHDAAIMVQCRAPQPDGAVSARTATFPGSMPSSS